MRGLASHMVALVATCTVCWPSSSVWKQKSIVRAGMAASAVSSGDALVLAGIAASAGASRGFAWLVESFLQPWLDC